MSIANWNSITQYLVGDQVYDGSSDYYYAIANNINSNPPSANWVKITPVGAGVSALNAGDSVEIVGYVPPGSDHCRALANPVDLTHPVAIPSIITDILRIQ